MSSATLLRPGSVLGAYPQREDLREGWLDRAADSTIGFLRQHVRGRSLRYHGFIDAVNQQAVTLPALDETELKARVAAFRSRLYSEGLKDELVAECFAMVREMTSRRLGMRQFDVQLYGGWVMLQGMIAEMETGEGKTLTATLPACTAALAG
ncbi:MAG: prepilin peptidase, partial [Gammaproteobacteria bacterium]|nr:prepilin peptidase [Gammaproteobacteria bacterium]